MLIALNPESQVTIISRAGSGNTESSSTNTVAAPPLHTVVINEIIKEQGQNVSNEDVNNAVQVANKRNAVIKGATLPTHLAGGSTTQIPVTINYNDGSTQEITETIRTKVNKLN